MRGPINVSAVNTRMSLLGRLDHSQVRQLLMDTPRSPQAEDVGWGGNKRRFCGRSAGVLRKALPESM